MAVLRRVTPTADPGKRSSWGKAPFFSLAPEVLAAFYLANEASLRNASKKESFAAKSRDEHFDARLESMTSDEEMIEEAVRRGTDHPHRVWRSVHRIRRFPLEMARLPICWRLVCVVDLDDHRHRCSSDREFAD